MTARLNHARARHARAAIDEHARKSGNVDETAVLISDLIADLGHYCDRQKLDFLCLVKRGIGHWYVEQDDPDSSLTRPPVTIAIDGEVQP